MKKVTDFSYVRFHAILDDENGVYSEDAQGNPVYNWSYVDQIYDGLLAHGVRPFVEISFMPKALAPKAPLSRVLVQADSLAAGQLCEVGRADHGVRASIWWSDTGSTKWRSGISKYGTSRTSISGSGKPAQQTYFELYDHTARALKAVSERIRVGGPATAQAAWVGDMIAHATQNDVPLDFVSTHVYGNDASKDVFHDTERSRRTRWCARRWIRCTRRL